MKKKALLAVICALCAAVVSTLAGCNLINKTTATTTPAGQTTVAPTTAGQTTTVDNGPQKDPNASYTYRAAANSLPTSWNIHTYQSNTATIVLDYTEDAFYTFDYNENKDGYVIVPSMATAMPVDVTADYASVKWGISADDEGRAYKITLRSDLKFADGKAITVAEVVESVKLLLDPEANNYRADSMYSGNLKITNAENYYKGGKFAWGEFVSENYGEEEYIYPEDWKIGEDGYYYVEIEGVTYNFGMNINDGGNWGSNPLSKYQAYGYLEVYETNEKGQYILVNAEGKDVYYYEVDAEENYTFYNLAGEVVTPTEEELEALTDKVNENAWNTLSSAADEDGNVKLNAETMKAFQDCIAILHGYDTVEEYAEDDGDYAYVEWEEMGYLGRSYEKIEFEEVGIFVDPSDANSLIIILDKTLKGFYLNYALCQSFYLVDTELYKSCISSEAGVYSNNYGTSVDTYNSFGPYKLTYYLDGNEIKMEKNEYWYGYGVAENANLYWTTAIDYKQVSGETDRLNMFLNGETDSYGLTADDMDDYQTSKYTYFTDGDSTWFVAINPNYDALVEMQSSTEPVIEGNSVNKTALTVIEFRQALSFSIDRAAYSLALDPLAGTAKALYGNMIISDPEAGTAYRTTDEAKDVILKFWGLYDEVMSEDSLYENKDEAIASITGYDPAGAKVLFTKAYEKMVEEGYLTSEQISSGKWEVQIMIGQPGSGSSKYYNNGYELLKKTWTEAVVGTPFEGHITFRQSQPLGSSTFSNYLKNNTVDILFGVGWTGSALDPYGLMEAYVSPNYQYDPAWDTTETDLDIEIDGKVLRASVYDWGKVALNGDEIEATVIVNGEATDDTVTLSAGPNDPAATRLAILAAVEGAVLNQYDMIPVNTDSSANLKGMKIKYGTEEYVFGVGRGGIKYMTYNYNDTEWAAFVQAQGGTLNYKVSN